jgi:Na+/glutamate symporter
LASSNLLSQPVLIGDQFASEAITCTTAGFALATISGIVVAAELRVRNATSNINPKGRSGLRNDDDLISGLEVLITLRFAIETRYLFQVFPGKDLLFR